MACTIRDRLFKEMSAAQAELDVARTRLEVAQRKGGVTEEAASFERVQQKYNQVRLELEAHRREHRCEEQTSTPPGTATSPTESAGKS
jgi:hypothetical protein